MYTSISQLSTFSKSFRPIISVFLQTDRSKEEKIKNECLQWIPPQITDPFRLNKPPFTDRIDNGPTKQVKQLHPPSPSRGI